MTGRQPDRQTGKYLESEVFWLLVYFDEMCRKIRRSGCI